MKYYDQNGVNVMQVAKSDPLSDPLQQWKSTLTIVAAFSMLLCPLVVRAQTLGPMQEDMEFYCGDIPAGHMTVSISGLQFGIADNTTGKQTLQCPDGTWTANAGMTMNAKFTPENFDGSRYAWMQTVISYTGPTITRCLSDPTGANLVAPYADTPPGGYLSTNICGLAPLNSSPHDVEPWYADTKLGTKSILDTPHDGVIRTGAKPSTKVSFETWLVCVVADQSGPVVKCVNSGDCSVIPLMGFTWDYTYGYVNGKAGKTTAEYTGATHLGPLIQAMGNMGPSDAFKAGYSKYFPNLTYLPNDSSTCLLCLPEPGVVAMGEAGILCLISWRYGWRRRKKT